LRRTIIKPAAAALFMVVQTLEALRAEPGKLQPVTLSNEQRLVVWNGVKKALMDSESLPENDMTAGKDDKGIITVCGWIILKDTNGKYVTESIPYVGLLLGKDSKEFILISEQKLDIDRYLTLEMCQSIGLDIN
jgi:hypothetical protein